MKNGTGEREHKTPYQTLILEKEYTTNPTWSRDKINELARKLNLKPNQVYKWNWDRNESKVKKYLNRNVEGADTSKLIEELMTLKPQDAATSLNC
jgi:hypothetical protein